jgi:hypothetical protein
MPKSTAPSSDAAKPKAPGGGRKLKYSVAVRHIDKKRYPKRPNNALGDTASTWVIPKDSKPEYNKKQKGTDEETEGKTSASPEGEPQLKVKAPAVSETDHGPAVQEVDSKTMVPKAAEQSLLGQSKPKGLPPPAAGIDQKIAEGQKALAAAKEGKPAQLEDGTKIHSTKDGDKVVGHTITKPDGTRETASSDKELLDKVSGGKKAVMTADDHRNRAAAAKEAGAFDLANKHEKIAHAKEKLADKNAPLSEEGKRMESLANAGTKKANAKIQEESSEPMSDEAKRMERTANALTQKTNTYHQEDLETDRKHRDDIETADQTAKEFKEKLKVRKDKTDKAAETKPKKQSKEEKDLETADKEAAKFREKLSVRKDKADAKEKAALEKKTKSSDEKVVKEAQKELKAKAEERSRKAKTPDSPEEYASHKMHTSKAKDAVNKVGELESDPYINDTDKEQLKAVKEALMDHAKQKHAPNNEESKKLNGMVKVVNHMHGNQAKRVKSEAKVQKQDAKLKVKEQKAKDKENEKRVKLYVKEKKAAQKAEEKAAKEAAKPENVKDIVAHTPQQPDAKKKIGLGAFHSGRAAGAAASSAAASDTGASLGRQALSGAVSGAATAGHKLLGGADDEKKETRYTVHNRKVDKKGEPEQSSVAKSLWYDDYEEEVESESLQLVKALNTKLKNDLCPMSPREYEFLARECGYSSEKISKGLVSVHGKLESRYAEWLCKRIGSSVTDLLGVLNE